MKNYQKIAIIGANLRGMMCARSLIKQGLHVSIFDEMKGGSSRNLEDLLEYIPIICDNYKENPIFKLFNEGRTSYGSFLIDFDVCDKDYKFISDENLENSEKKFFELINEIFNTKGKIKIKNFFTVYIEDENGNFHAKFNFLLEKGLLS